MNGRCSIGVGPPTVRHAFALPNRPRRFHDKEDKTEDFERWRRCDLLTNPKIASCLIRRISQVAAASLASYGCAAAMKVVRVQTPADFDKVVADVLAHAPGPVFVVLFGSEDPETHESWCPDCVIADPLIRTAIRGVPDSTLIECPVGARSEYGRGARRAVAVVASGVAQPPEPARPAWGRGCRYKNKPEHPYRLHPQIKLTAVPTLVRWTKVRITDRAGRAVSPPLMCSRLCIAIAVQRNRTAPRRGWWRASWRPRTTSPTGSRLFCKMLCNTFWM